jgi:GGDEF domain-containing protein
MSTTQEPLKITVLSADTRLLHDVAWMLTAVGYTVDTTKEFEHNAVWRRYADFDVLIVDGRKMLAPYEPILANDSHNPVYRIVLYDPASTPDFSAWQAAGANDGLGVPVSRGELLTRIRTAARYLEFERRLRRWSTRSQLQDLFSQRGFLRKLARLSALQLTRHSQPNHILLATSIDWYRGMAGKGGQNASERLIAATARAIRSSAGETAVIAYIGAGRFLTLLSGQTMQVARAIAERVANDFGSRESHRESLGRSTLTSALVPWNLGTTPEKLVETSLETLTVARQSGGDCVVEPGEYDKELAAWTNEVAAGNPFAHVVAQDIMEFFPAVLTCDSDQSATIAALRRAGVPVCPYVDRHGRLTGVASAEEPAGATGSTHLPVLPIRKPETIQHTATFAEIYEAFSASGCSTLVVVADDHPLGYLTFNGFLSLVEPAGIGTFAEAGDTPDDSRQLVVPSLSSDCEPA